MAATGRMMRERGAQDVGWHQNNKRKAEAGEIGEKRRDQIESDPPVELLP
jgi:hypothetical protein